MAQPHDDLDRILDGFTARVRSHLRKTERRIKARRAKQRDAYWEGPVLPSGCSLSALKPSLDDYDAYEK